MILSNEILNKGLELSMEFGENLLKPINERLSIIYPSLTKDSLFECNSICYAAQKFSNEVIYKLFTDSNWKVSSEDIKNEFHITIKRKYPWVSDENLISLLNIGSIYAWK